MSRPKKIKSDQRADTRGGKWVGIPHAVVDSAAYRHSSLWARAVLVELVREFNGYNNGAIALSQREVANNLSTTNFRKIGAAIAELMQLGLIDVSAEGQWKERQARLYRLTFVTTTHAPATNDYLKWAPSQKSGDDDVSARKPRSADDVSAERKKAADDVSARIAEHRRKTAVSLKVAADDVSSLICKPYPPAQTDGAKGDDDHLNRPLTGSGHHFASETDPMADEVRSALSNYRRSQGLDQVRALATASLNEPGRVIDFIDRRDALSPPAIARLSREIFRTSQQRGAV